jgi:hypothetical protein
LSHDQAHGSSEKSVADSGSRTMFRCTPNSDYGSNSRAIACGFDSSNVTDESVSEAPTPVQVWFRSFTSIAIDKVGEANVSVSVASRIDSFAGDETEPSHAVLAAFAVPDAVTTVATGYTTAKPATIDIAARFDRRPKARFTISQGSLVTAHVSPPHICYPARILMVLAPRARFKRRSWANGHREH